MKNIFLPLAFLLFFFHGYTQTIDTTITAKGDTIITQNDDSYADSLRIAGDMKGAINAYRKMYEGQGKNFKELYNYADALAIDHQIDSAFKYLKMNMEAERGVDQFRLADPNFLNLWKDSRWKDIEDETIARVQKAGKIRDIEYARKLWQMFATDQAYNDCLKIAEDKVGQGSSVVDAIWDLKERIRGKNPEELEQLVETRGWPKKSEVGQIASYAAFLVIQHADLEKQKKYLPMIEELCKESEAEWESYALMYDRVQTFENKPQKYGSQIRYNDETKKYELFPLLDASKVDEWRKEVGMEPLQYYVAAWGIKFEPGDKK